MRVLVTGGAGFVMSNVVRALLSKSAEARAVVLDLGGRDEAAADFLAPFAHRIDWTDGDIRDESVVERAFSFGEITHVVHGATLTHFEGWEREDPGCFMDVNVMGTIRLLDRARCAAGLERFVYVSSGAVYGEPGDGTPSGPQPESGPFDLPEMYAISKFAAEMVARRYGELFDLDVVRVRFSGVFGPMERRTRARCLMSAPYHMVRAHLEGRPLRVTRGTLDAGGDFLSAEEVGEGVAALLRAPRCAHRAYNIAAGRFQTMEEVFGTFRSVAPGFELEVADEGRAEVAMNPDDRLARWNAYAIDRMRDDIGWRPRPLSEQLGRYLRWVEEDPERRCPRLD